MGKLVVFLKDASPVEVPLDKERVTIGRRPDNDVCLPHPAVSGEHATVVTILADSFLEDLGSTNGTLVNGKPIAKHFLRDRDQIDIGRQLIVYLADATAPADIADPYDRSDRRDLVRPIEARVEPKIVTPIGAALDGPSADLEAELDRAGALRDAGRPPDVPEAPMRLRAGAIRRVESAPVETEGSSAETTNPVPRATAALAPPPTDDARADVAPSRRDAGRAPLTTTAPALVPPPPAVRRGRVEVLDGPQAGRTVDVTADAFVIGRIGVQVVALVGEGEHVVLVPREGPPPVVAEGDPIPADGRTLAPGEAFEVAGVRVAWHASDVTSGVT
jgi:predicted component of type VI protein secretion system